MLAVPAGAQTVGSSDIDRLQNDVYQASSDISRLRSTDSTAASRLQDELDDLRDEVTYLKVKLRKEGNINRADYTEVRDRVADLRSRARNDAALPRDVARLGLLHSRHSTMPNQRQRNELQTPRLRR